MKVTVVNLLDASYYLTNHEHKDRWDALISIGDPNREPPKGFHNIKNKLRLEFHDVDGSLANDDWTKKHEVIPNEGHVRQIISFVSPLKDVEGEMLIHCHAGVSRSTATCFITHCLWMGPGEEDRAMQATFEDSEQDWIFPNDIMVEIADDILDRSGEMVKAIHRATPDF